MDRTQPPRERRQPQQSRQSPTMQAAQATQVPTQAPQPTPTPTQPAESTMPPRRRRQHKRSRNGCYTCKQRHIRCDEQKPICTNCLVRGGACGYPIKANSGPSTSDSKNNNGSDHGGTSSSNTTTSTRTTADARDPALSNLVASWPFDDLGNHAGDNLNIFEFELPFRPPYLPFPSPALPTYQLVDPFDSLPVAMPLRSMELFHHMTHFRILTRSLVPKNPNNSCIAMVLQDAGLFRGCLLLTAMHYAWINGSLADMEETYLYHKVEAIRLVNEHISDPAWSELCANVIAALALAESGIGDIAAAEAHLNGLFTLINWRKPEEWQGRLHGLFQRLILVAGTFISASKSVEDGRLKNTDNNTAGKPPLHFTRPTTANFSAAQFDATKLSPFYFATPPDYEASNADLEGMAITNALQRLSSLPEGYKKPQPPQSSRTHPATTSASSSRTAVFSPTRAECSQAADGITMGQELTQVLLLETESYLTSLLFRPGAPPEAMSLSRQMYQPPERLTSMNNSPHRQANAEVGAEDHNTPTLTRSQGLADTNDIMEPFMMDFDPRMLSPSGFMDASNNNNNNTASGSMASTAPSPATSHATISTNHSAHSVQAAYSAAASPLVFRTPPPATTLPSSTYLPAPATIFSSSFPPYMGPFDGVSPALLPSSSRAWSAGAYLYLHTFLADLWLPPRPPSYLPPNYLPPTQSRIDRDLRRWLLDTLCASLERTREAMQLGAYNRELWIWQVLVGAYVVAKTRHEGGQSIHEKNARRQTQATPQMSAGPCIDPTLLDPADMSFERYRMSSAAMPSASPATASTNEKPPEYYLGAWFRTQMRVWSDAIDAQHWNDAKRHASTVAWPQNSWAGETLIEDLWSRAMAGQGSP